MRDANNDSDQFIQTWAFGKTELRICNICG